MPSFRSSAIALIAASSALVPALGAQEAGSVYRVHVSGTIELGLAPFIERSLREAEQSGASAVVLAINTPGGRIDAAERIADAVRDAAVPVYAFVDTRAFSAGALIALATQRIYMRPGSVIGAATPVGGSGEKAPEKIVSAMRSEMRALAEARGLDPAVAEAMVDEDVEIPGVTEKGKLLTLSTAEAVDLGYATEVDDWSALLEELGVRGEGVVTPTVNWAERLVRFFSNPVVAPFLLSLGFLGLIVEIKSPGLGMAGLAGVVSLALFFGSHHIVGLAGWEDMIIFFAGVVLLAVEAFVLPGFGIFGVLGVGAVAGGLLLSLVGSLPTRAEFAEAGTILSLSLIIVIVTAWALIRRLPRSDRMSRSGILLTAATERELGYTSASRREDLVGREGVAITDLRPSGVGLFGDERVDIVTDSEWIQEGAPIRIVSSEGYRHVVRSVGPDRAPESA